MFKQKGGVGEGIKKKRKALENQGKVRRSFIAREVARK